ncbi:conserved membrane hypothetical protein [Limnobacter sp. 130]|uniref:hypothetical protein n=1 Tax=Limnobacter sp. 130 TaxID=2653147 RepID=UPI0012F1A184|nr:hypothetical protein [Limnobacter sp. 130]VWX36642.1 conserved membrane hypothetical protein [Limnobacter sp. 130]
MAGSPPLVSTHSGAVVPVESRFSPRKDDFSLPACRAHTIRKANYKSLSHGQLVRKGWQSRLRAWIEGNNADARYHRAAYESSQRVSAALFAEQYKNAVDGKQVNVFDSALLKARFYRQDNLRFNPELSEPRFGLSKPDQRAVKLSRWAHCANGVTELGAAPTGLLLKLSKIAITPNRDDKSFTSQLRVLAALPLVAGAVALFSRGVFTESLGRAFNNVSQALLADMRALACSFSAISAVSAMVSLALGASSCMVASKSSLSGAVTGLIQFNKDKHLHRIFLLLNDVKNKPGAITLLAKALRYKIGEKYCAANSLPLLLNRLLENANNYHNEAQIKQAIEKTIGSYLTELSPTGSTPGNFLDARSAKAELLARENHFLALTNLIEHSAVHSDPHENFMDLRHCVEKGAETLRKGVSKSLVHVLGFVRKEGVQAQVRPTAASLRYSAESMLNNSHQYGPVTRSLARMSEGLRVFNHGILMSLNYQLTRPIAKLAGYITESALKIPNSRTASFSIGRAVASSIWAAVDAFLFLSLAAGNGVGLGGPEALTKVKFPLNVPFGAIGLGISIISTAAQMLLVAIPAAILMGAAKGACHLEGWNGNVARPLELAGSKRKPVAWA